MDRRRVVIVLGIGAVLTLAALGYLLYRSHTGDEQTETFLRAPDFTLPTLDGTPISLSDIDGEVRVVNFWASWSPYSRDELQAFARLKDTFGDEVSIVALDRDTNPNDGRAFVQELGISDDRILFVFDQQDAYFKQVSGFAVPETLFVDTDGNIRSHAHGPLTYEQMEVAVRDILE